MILSPTSRITGFADVEALEARLRAMARLECEEPGLSELDHALQCAQALERVAPDDVELQVAGLVHDICQGEAHDRVGARAVGPILGRRVASLVGLHVAAKRYLVSRDDGYRARLSHVSTDTLASQGGAMNAAQATVFEMDRHSHDAIRLRLADETAKVVGAPVDELEPWLSRLREVARGVR